ncbi:MAG: phasin family protein [Parerythrobacter sp.]
MATSTDSKPQGSKIDSATEKAYADATAKTAKTEKVDLTVVAEAVEADAPVKSSEPKKPAMEKAAVKKPAAKKAVAKKSAVMKVPAKQAATQPAVEKSTTSRIPTKENIMTTAKATTEDMTAKLKDGVAELQTRAQTVYGKGSELASEMGEFAKGNAEAMVESGKIVVSGVQHIAKTQFEDGKTAVQVMTADVKEMAAVKSPTELVQLQGKLVSRNFDATIAQVSKTTGMWVKLANDAFAPISGRMSVAMEKVRSAA